MSISIQSKSTRFESIFYANTLNHIVLLASFFALAEPAIAHGVGARDSSLILGVAGSQPVLFAYLGAKHMITGVDHLLYLLGVFFFLQRPRDVLLYATLFSLGHSTTLLLGVLIGTPVNAILIDVVIGLSIVYKALENLGAFRTATGSRIDPHVAIFAFGLCHGLGLASKLQEINASAVLNINNLLFFNVGVELGQFSFLTGLLLLRYTIQARPRVARYKVNVNIGLLYAGFVLALTQTTHYIQTKGLL